MELLQPFDMALAPHVKGGRCLPMVMFRQARCFINFLGRGPHVLIGPHVHMQVLVYLYATRCSMNLSRDNQQPQFSNIGLDSSRFNCLFLGYVHTEREKRFAVASVIPHAICTRYLLAVGAKFVRLVRILMIMCYPTSYPIRKIMEILADNLLELVIGSTRTLIPYQSSIPTISSTISEGCEGPDSELMLSMIGLLVPVVSCGRRYM